MEIIGRIRIWFAAQPPAIRGLLLINIGLYLTWQLVFSWIPVTDVFTKQMMALNPEVPGIFFRPWQLVTYNFLHLGNGFWGFVHVLFNMLWLVWIGRDYELMHGSHRLTAIYLIAGIGGGLVTVLLATLFPDSPFDADIVFGASASVLGVLAAVATFFPHKSIGLLFIGNIPMPVLVVGILVFDLLLMSGSSTAVGAHLGGALFGFLFAKSEKAGMNLSGWANVFFRAPRSRTTAQRESVLRRLESWLSRKDGPKGASGSLRVVKSSADATHKKEPEGAVVDDLLDKISEEGYESLTEDEKRILYEASRK